jgi:hypothetical protein
LTTGTYRVEPSLAIGAITPPSCPGKASPVLIFEYSPFIA